MTEETYKLVLLAVTAVIAVVEAKLKVLAEFEVVVKVEVLVTAPPKKLVPLTY